MQKAGKKALVLLSVILLCAVVFKGTSAASRGGMSQVPAQTQNARFSQERGDSARIISVLEREIGSRRLPAQAKEKLATMREEDYRLVAALCDRIETANDRAGADLALLLAAALIVLS